MIAMSIECETGIFTKKLALKKVQCDNSEQKKTQNNSTTIPK